MKQKQLYPELLIKELLSYPKYLINLQNEANSDSKKQSDQNIQEEGAIPKGKENLLYGKVIEITIIKSNRK